MNHQNMSEELRSLSETCSWPSLYYELTSSILKACDARYVAEIGVAYGLHATHILSSFPDIRYVGIDPYLPGYDPSDVFERDVAKGYQTEPDQAFESLFTDVEELLTKNFPGRATILREPSEMAHTKIGDDSLDLVFVDGNHTFEAVQSDIRNWFPKIRSGGLLIGDDWSWESVKKAWEVEARNLGRRPFLIVNPSNGYSLVGIVK